MNIHTARELELRDMYIEELRLQLGEKSQYIVKLESENKKLRKVAYECEEYVMGRTIYKDGIGKALAALEQSES